ncbi:Hpt domain-containing protein, partial [Duganella vulcania]
LRLYARSLGAELAPAVPPGPDDFDPSVLASLCAANPERLERYIDAFIDSLRQAIVEIKVAIEQEDSAGVGMLGHRIKSTASAAGATGLADLGRALEATRAEGNLRQARDLAARLPACLEAIQRQIEAHKPAMQATRE